MMEGGEGRNEPVRACVGECIDRIEWGSESRSIEACLYQRVNQRKAPKKRKLTSAERLASLKETSDSSRRYCLLTSVSLQSPKA